MRFLPPICKLEVKAQALPGSPTPVVISLRRLRLK